MSLKGSLKEKAQERFAEVGLPQGKTEAFQYVPLAKLYATTYDANPAPFNGIVSPMPECFYVVFINGELRLDLSELPEEVVILPFDEAMLTYGPLLQNKWNTSLKEETDPFALYNMASSKEALFVYVPPQCELKKPLQCLTLSTSGVQLSMPRVHLFLGEGAKMTWIATDEGMGWTNLLIDISLSETSELTLFSSLKNFTGWHFDHVRAHLKKGSRFSSCSLQFPEGVARSSYRVVLAGEEASCELQGLWNLDQEAQVHIHAHVEHRAPHTKSFQRFKGILDNSSKSSFEGKIYVHSEAQKTEAYQLCNHMILGPGAIGNAKPNLEIFADDVKASHGATMAQLSDEELFYLRSRGIGLEEAKRLLIDSFSQEILSGVPYVTLLP